MFLFAIKISSTLDDVVKIMTMHDLIWYESVLKKTRTTTDDDDDDDDDDDVIIKQSGRRCEN